MRYSPKQIEKYKRQKYISLIEKIGKNLFKMFRDPNIGSKKFQDRFSTLMKELEKSEKVELNSEYIKESKNYYERLYLEIKDENFDDEYLNSIRKSQMSRLNRLQKMKNRKSYKRKTQKDTEEY